MYAKGTTVSPAATRAEIERTIEKYGATGFGYATQDLDGVTLAAITFIAHGRQIRFVVQLPSRTDRAFTHTPARKTPRDAAGARQAWEQACRERWRSLSLMVKSKLESVASGIVTFEDEFLAYTVVPGTNRTVAEQIGPDLSAAISAGADASLLQIEPGDR